MGILSSKIDGLLDPRRLTFPIAVLLGSVAVAWGVTNRPLVMGGTVFLGVILTAVLYFQRRLPRIYLRIFWICLLGYAFAGKGFAYAGRSPLYIGEMVLFLGILTFFLCDGWRSVKNSPLTWLWIAFAAWGAIRTIPYISTYGIDAMRDAVIWGYGSFALIVAACLIRTGWLARVPTAYRRFVPFFTVWAMIDLLARHIYRPILPAWPGTDQQLIQIKPGDTEVHLAGVAAFLLVGLYSSERERNGSRGLKEWLLWVIWLAAFMPAAMQNRGGMLAVLCSFFIVLILRPGSRWKKLVLVSLILGSMGLISNLDWDYGGARSLSVPQLMENIKSVVSENVEEGKLTATRRWRLEWWEDIAEYTLFGPYFWTGKGFGVNLGEGASVLVGEDTRSPHNGHLTILGRMGVPGTVLWLLLHGAFGIGLLRAFLKARSEGNERWASFNLWILAYWSAFLVNGAFDVYLEGPQGGICLWAVFGVGIAALEVQRRERVYRSGMRPGNRTEAFQRA
jgi:hypothetical protein